MSGRCFAVIPAAGHSRRMGRPKLQLPLADATMIDRVLKAWTTSCVDVVVIVIRRDDSSLIRLCQRWPVEIVSPTEDPRDMKESVQAGLKHLRTTQEPRQTDRCFFAPADLPAINASLIDRLLQVESEANNIVVPEFGGRTGHPVLFPWSVTSEVFHLLPDEGIRSLLDRHPLTRLPLAAEERLADIDTPADYQRMARQMSGREDPPAD